MPSVHLPCGEDAECVTQLTSVQDVLDENALALADLRSGADRRGDGDLQVLAVPDLRGASLDGPPDPLTRNKVDGNAGYT